MSRILSIVVDGIRKDMTIDEFNSILKGGPGSGRKPDGDVKMYDKSGKFTPEYKKQIDEEIKARTRWHEGQKEADKKRKSGDYTEKFVKGGPGSGRKPSGMAVSPNKLNIDQAVGLLSSKGYKLNPSSFKFDSQNKTTSYEVTDKDGNVKRMPSQEIKSLLFEKGGPGSGRKPEGGTLNQKQEETIAGLGRKHGTSDYSLQPSERGGHYAMFFGEKKDKGYGPISAYHVSDGGLDTRVSLKWKELDMNKMVKGGPGSGRHAYGQGAQTYFRDRLGVKKEPAGAFLSGARKTYYDNLKSSFGMNDKQAIFHVKSHMGG